MTFLKAENALRNEERFLSLDQDFISMRVSTLRGDLKIDFDVYVKINDKMILYIRRGDSFEGPRLKRLREKKTKKNVYSKRRRK